METKVKALVVLVRAGVERKPSAPNLKPSPVTPPTVVDGGVVVALRHLLSIRCLIVVTCQPC